MSSAAMELNLNAVLPELVMVVAAAVVMLAEDVATYEARPRPRVRYRTEEEPD